MTSQGKFVIHTTNEPQRISVQPSPMMHKARMSMCPRLPGSLALQEEPYSRIKNNFVSVAVFVGTQGKQHPSHKTKVNQIKTASKPHMVYRDTQRSRHINVQYMCNRSSSECAKTYTSRVFGWPKPKIPSISQNKPHRQSNIGILMYKFGATDKCAADRPRMC